MYCDCLCSALKNEGIDIRTKEKLHRAGVIEKSLALSSDFFVFNLPHFLDGNVEAQRRKVTCLRSHGDLAWSSRIPVCSFFLQHLLHYPQVTQHFISLSRSSMCYTVRRGLPPSA